MQKLLTNQELHELLQYLRPHELAELDRLIASTPEPVEIELYLVDLVADGGEQRKNETGPYVYRRDRGLILKSEA